ncbi:MAG: hypothetical protein N3A54_04175 [Patescibacteria group bacterium]|nr:hypothetical protein [Patescibacteria group bacterium]
MSIEQQKRFQEWQQYQRREEERRKKLEEIELAKIKRVARLFYDGEKKRSEFDIISDAIDKKAPGLKPEEKLRLIQIAIGTIEQRAGREYISPGFFNNLSLSRIQGEVLRHIGMLERYVNPHPLADTIRTFLEHGVVHKTV